MARSSKYDAARLAPIVASSRSLAEVLRRLGLPPTGGNYRYISARIRTSGLDVSHLGAHRSRARLEALSATALADLVATSTSIAQMLGKLALPQEGRPHRELTRRIGELGIDTSHFRGQGWARGESKDTHPSLARASRRKTITDEELFHESSSSCKGARILRRLLELGWEYRCAWCGISEWRGQRIVLHLDHINGINNDNRFVNLRILCPNCHSQTPTYSNRRR